VVVEQTLELRLLKQSMTGGGGNAGTFARMMLGLAVERGE
jgi:hypothetical protein